MWRPAQVLLTGVVACAVLAACGSSNNGSTTTPLSAQQYKEFLHRLGQREAQAHKAFDPTFKNPTSVSDLQQALNTFASDQEQLAAQVSNVTPPANAKAANDQLAKGFKDTAA